MAARKFCSGCGGLFALSQRGLTWGHWVMGRVCPGSGKPPGNTMPRFVAYGPGYSGGRETEQEARAIVDAHGDGAVYARIDIVRKVASTAFSAGRGGRR